MRFLPTPTFCTVVRLCLAVRAYVTRRRISSVDARRSDLPFLRVVGVARKFTPRGRLHLGGCSVNAGAGGKLQRSLRRGGWEMARQTDTVSLAA